MKKIETYKDVIIENLKCIEDPGKSDGHNRILKILCLNCGKEFYLRPYQFKQQKHICKKQYEGLKNGVLTCIKDLGIQQNNNKREHLLKVLCERCGKMSIVRTDKLTSKIYIPQSCTYCINDLQKEIADKKYKDSRQFRRKYRSIIENAKSRNIKVLLTQDEIKSIIDQPCYYCGETKNIGIDRIDSNKDYTLDNCVPCCKICNRMKNKFSLSVFLDKIDKIYNKFFIEGPTTIENTLKNGSEQSTP